MAKVERGVPLVDRIIERLEPRVRAGKKGKGAVVGARDGSLNRLESQLGVELPRTLRRFLQFDFKFDSFGERWRGRGRFGEPAAPHARITTVRKIAEGMTELGWSSSRLRGRLVRLPNLPGEPWNALYLGEARSDGELCILGFVNDETSVIPYVRYTAFDLYLVEQSGLVNLSDSQRLDDFESHLAVNPELGTLAPDDEYDAAF
jgi:hypothetical protein